MGTESKTQQSTSRQPNETLIRLQSDQLQSLVDTGDYTVYGIPYGTKVRIAEAGDSITLFKAKNFPINLIDILTSDDYHYLLEGEFTCEKMPAHVISDSISEKVYVEPDFDTDGTFPIIRETPAFPAGDMLRGYLLIDRVRRVKCVCSERMKSVPSKQYLEACKEVINTMDFSLIRKVEGESYDETYVLTIFDLFCLFRLKTTMPVQNWDLQLPMRMVVRRDKSKFFHMYKSLKGAEYQVFCLMLELFRKDRSKALTVDGTLNSNEVSKYKQLIHTIYHKVRE